MRSTLPGAVAGLRTRVQTALVRRRVRASIDEPTRVLLRRYHEFLASPAAKRGPAPPRAPVPVGGFGGDSVPWPPSAIDRVFTLQQRGYRTLGRRLGVGSDARAAFERLRHSEERLPPLSGGDGLEATLESMRPWEWLVGCLRSRAGLDAYLERSVPTEFEVGERFAVVSFVYDQLRAFLGNDSAGSGRAILATLPSGDLAARAIRDLDSDRYLLLFEQGLFEFLAEFACLIGWVFPPLPDELVVSDAEIASISADKWKVSIAARLPYLNFQTGVQFYETFGCYAVDGHCWTSREAPRPTHNSGLCTTLLIAMYAFVILHEVSHIDLGHLDMPTDVSPNPQLLEHHADNLAAAAVPHFVQEAGGSWAVGAWASDLALTALNFLYRAIGVFAYGTGSVRWGSATHPDPLTRRALLRAQLKRSVGPVPQMIAALTLADVSDAALQALWQTYVPMWQASRSMAGIQASVLWNDMLEDGIIVPKSSRMQP